MDRPTRVWMNTFIGDDPTAWPTSDPAATTLLELWEGSGRTSLGDAKIVSDTDHAGPGHCSFREHTVDAGSYSVVVLNGSEVTELPSYGLRMRLSSPVRGMYSELYPEQIWMPWLPTQPDGLGGGPTLYKDGHGGTPGEDAYRDQGVPMADGARCATIHKDEEGPLGWADDACELYLPYICVTTSGPDTPFSTVTPVGQEGPWEQNPQRCRSVFGDAFFNVQQVSGRVIRHYATVFFDDALRGGGDGVEGDVFPQASAQ